MRNLTEKAIRGSLSYFIRQILVSGVGIVSSVVILFWLGPKDFGFYASVSLVLGVGQIIAEGGLSVYLVQRAEDINNFVLSQIASFQLFVYILAHILILIIFLIFHLASINTTLITYVLVAMFVLPINILRANSFVGLERDMVFNRIAIIEIVESIVFSCTSLGLAFLGIGVWSLIFGSIAKSLFGLLFSYTYSKWKFKFKLPHLTNELKRGIKFGINYHLPSLITTIRISINPILVGGLLGLSAVGIADRAIYFAGLPLFFLGAIQQRVLFPYFSRIQSEDDMVRSNFEKSYYISGIIDKIFYIPLVLFITQLINLFAPKWIETIPLFYIAIIGNILFGALSFSSFPVLNGLGKSSVVAKLSIFTMIVTWVITYPLIKLFGVSGYALVGLVLWLIGLVPGILFLKKFIKDVSLWKPFIIPNSAFVLACFCGYFLIKLFTTITFPMIILLSIIAIMFYFVFLIVFDGKNIFKMFLKLKAAFLPLT